MAKAAAMTQPFTVAVALDFKHALAKVRFAVSTTVASGGPQMKITSIALTGPWNVGTVDLSTGGNMTASGAANLVVNYTVDGVDATPKSVDLTTVLASNSQTKYTIALSLTEISFTLSEEAWDAETESAQ